MARQLMDAAGIERTLRRLASQIVEDRGSPEVPLALVGIRRGGVPLAKRLAAHIAELEGVAPEVGAIDITLYRDDLYTGLEKPSFGVTQLPPVDGTAIVLVDDVLFTGRTVLAALGVIRDYGRPRQVKLAVLVDRGHRELPVQADFVGKVIDTERTDKVLVWTGEEPNAADTVQIERGQG